MLKKIENKLRSILSRSKILTFIWNIYCQMKGRGRFQFIPDRAFSGWGMTTYSRTPWSGGGGHQVTQDFCAADSRLKKSVVEKRFTLSQFANRGSRKSADQVAALDRLMWRHYFVYWSAAYASNNTHSIKKNFAECGVCDGLTAFYALSAANAAGVMGDAYLYDSWEALKIEQLSESERFRLGDYAYLDIDVTKRNLNLIEGRRINFNKGYIPDVFSIVQNPETLVWLHVDLNLTVPTMDALNFFWDKLECGGVILFDDYAWEDSGKAAEAWSLKKNGQWLHFPTGQGLFIKSAARQT
jgi:Macrocin-O-methyltransferase (TylF)